MRKFCRLCSLILLLGMFSLLSACSDAISISGIDISLKESEGIVEISKKVQYGKSYEMRLESEGLEAYLEKIPRNRVVRITLTVTVKQEKQKGSNNIVNFNVKYMNKDGLYFEESKDSAGVYNAVASLELTKDGKCPDLSNGYFVIDINSLNEKSKNITAEEILSVEVKATGILLDKKGKEKSKEVIICVGSEANETLREDFVVEKGDYHFTEKDNISYRIGYQVEKNTMDIKLPEYCRKIKIDIYQDFQRKMLYGSIESAATKEGGTLSVVLTPYFKQFIGSEQYMDLVKAGNQKLYLTIIAVGENGYNDKSIPITYEVK